MKNEKKRKGSWDGGKRGEVGRGGERTGGTRREGKGRGKAPS